MPSFSPQGQQQDAFVRKMETTNNQNVAINIKDQTGRASVESDKDMIPINLTSTQAI